MYVYDYLIGKIYIFFSTNKKFRDFSIIPRLMVPMKNGNRLRFTVHSERLIKKKTRGLPELKIHVCL